MSVSRESQPSVSAMGEIRNDPAPPNYEVLGPDRVWRRLHELAATGPVRMAVAYAGPRAAEQVPCGLGDLVLVDASDRAVTTGSTSARPLRTWVEAGADVRSMPDLHAKVGVFGDAAFIGSANLSVRSDVQLSEAVLISRDPQIVSEIRRLVDALAASGVRLDLEDVDRLEALEPAIRCGAPVPPRWSQAGVLPKQPFRIYATPFYLDEWDPATTKRVSRAMRGARRGFETDGRMQVCGFPTEPDDPWPVATGDLVVFIGETDQEETAAFPPVQVLDVVNDVLVYLKDTSLEPVPLNGPRERSNLRFLRKGGSRFVRKARTPEILDAWDLDVMCPRCDSPGRVVVIGMPPGPPSPEDQLRYLFVGCAVDPETPQYVCVNCDHHWGIHRMVRDEADLRRLVGELSQS